MAETWWGRWVAGEGSEGHCAFCGHQQNRHRRKAKKEVNGVTEIIVRCAEEGCNEVYGVLADNNKKSVGLGSF